MRRARGRVGGVSHLVRPHAIDEQLRSGLDEVHQWDHLFISDFVLPCEQDAQRIRQELSDDDEELEFFQLRIL